VLGGAEFGAALAGAGDLNGDGHCDVVIGAPRYNAVPGESDHGRAYVYYGSSLNGLQGPADWANTPEPDLGAQFGFAVAGAGDVNGDGYSDLVVGAPDYDLPAGANNHGRIYVFQGGIAGLGPVPDRAVTVDPSDSAHRLGYAVAGVRDTDGDGRSDVAAAGREGIAYLFSGTSDVASWSFASANGFGEAMAGGDFNGDGFSDLVAGSITEPVFGQGTLYVFYGNDEGGARLRLTQLDGFDTPIRLGDESPTPTVHLEGVVSNAAWLGARVKLEVELRQVGEPFDAPTAPPTATLLGESLPGTAGSVLRVTFVALARGSYRWRARPLWPDDIGAGRWVDFGGNDPAQADFRVDWPISPDNRGDACTLNSQCSSGFCRDGVCCRIACDGICVECVAGSGLCTAFDEGDDPDNECGGICRTGGCSRQGGCQLSPVGTPCGTCLACDSAGDCVMPVTTGDCALDMSLPDPEDMGPPTDTLDPVPDLAPDREALEPAVPPDLRVADPFACDCAAGGRPAAPPAWLLFALAAALVRRATARRR